MKASSTSPGTISIGAFVFDPERRQLAGPAGAVTLPPKQFALLSLLVARRPNAVSKDEIQDEVWPRTSVAETSLTTLVKELRTSLAQEGRGGPVRTVHGFGYALDDEGSPSASSAVPRLLRGKKEIRLGSSELVLGREPGLPGTIDDASVSRRHARLRRHGQDTFLEDLGSKNGTFVGGVRISEPVSLKEGDEVRLGLVSFVYRTPRTEGISATKTVA